MKRKILTIALCLGIIFSSTVIYRGQDSKANGYGISNPRIESDGTVTWNCVYFGNYWQNDTNGDGIADENDEKEPIKWRVLSVDGNDAFLLADQNLDAKPYNMDEDVTWENTSLRKWINEDFYNIAFIDTEKKAIVETNVENENGDSTKDKVSLLSYTEASNMNYGFNSDMATVSETRQAKNTFFAKNCGAATALDNSGMWSLRSYDDFLVKLGLGKGEIYRSLGNGRIEIKLNSFVRDTDIGVRPCLHLDLSSDTWSNAGTVTATGGTFATPTPVPTDTPVPTIEPTATPTSVPTEVSTPTTLPTVQSTIQPTATPISTSKPMQSSTLTQKPKVTAPSKPKISSIKNNKKRTVTLSWNKVSGASGYQLEYATNEAFSKKSKTLKATKVTINKLKKKKTYSFRVRAYALDGNKKLYSKWSTVKRIKIKK